MRRRTLDIIVSVGALALAAVLLAVGLAMLANARFAENSTTEGLSREGISFKPVEALTDAEKEYTNERTGCVIAFAGQPVTTGEQARCFADEYILGHLEDPEGTAQGLTFAEWGVVQADLRAQIAEAEATGDPALAGLEEELAETMAPRESVFRGAMLRNALLTTYAFSVMGEKAAQAATLAFVAAGLLGLLAIAGLVHAYVTPKTRAFAPAGVEHPETEREFTGV